MPAKTVAKPEGVKPDEKPDPADAVPALRVKTEKRVRPTIEIDGKFYDLRVLGDFGIGKQQTLNRDGREFYQLWTSDDELTEDQQKRLKQLLERMYAEVLDAPKTVMRKLNDAEKADVVLTFTLAPLRNAMLAAQTEQTAETVEAGIGSTLTT